ncbi:MAG TPA: luciferase family protein [Nitrososphaeraceae archaeon]|nr:luciferase family protein [Nitrososphaeraceae archaeon]
MNKHDLDLLLSEKIKQELLSWKGVTVHEHNFVTMMFYVDGGEMGHLHGDSIADLKFPAKVSKRLVKEGRVYPHHVIPKSGWVSYEIRDTQDIEKVIELFRLQYDRLVKSK